MHQDDQSLAGVTHPDPVVAAELVERPAHDAVQPASPQPASMPPPALEPAVDGIAAESAVDVSDILPTGRPVESSELLDSPVADEPSAAPAPLHPAAGEMLHNDRKWISANAVVCVDSNAGSGADPDAGIRSVGCVADTPLAVSAAAFRQPERAVNAVAPAVEDTQPSSAGPAIGEDTVVLPTAAHDSVAAGQGDVALLAADARPDGHHPLAGVEAANTALPQGRHADASGMPASVCAGLILNLTIPIATLLSSLKS